MVTRFRSFTNFCARACCGVLNLFIMQNENKRLNDLKRNEVRGADFNQFKL